MKVLHGYDAVSGSWLYGRSFTTAEPYAITVYDAETVGTYNGRILFSLYKNYKDLVF